VKKKLFFTGMAALLLSFGLLLLACDNGDSDSDSSFDGSTLAGTKWTATDNMDVEEGKSIDLKMTLEFTSDIKGTTKIEVTKWNGTWTTAEKAYFEEMMSSMNGTFTSTYDAAAKTGTITMSGSTTPFTVDVGKKEITIGDSVLKLQ
jgi:hypothetical protein